MTRSVAKGKGGLVVVVLVFVEVDVFVVVVTVVLNHACLLAYPTERLFAAQALATACVQQALFVEVSSRR